MGKGGGGGGGMGSTEASSKDSLAFPALPPTQIPSLSVRHHCRDVATYGFHLQIHHDDEKVKEVGMRRETA